MNFSIYEEISNYVFLKRLGNMQSSYRGLINESQIRLKLIDSLYFHTNQLHIVFFVPFLSILWIKMKKKTMDSKVSDLHIIIALVAFCICSRVYKKSKDLSTR